MPEYLAPVEAFIREHHVYAGVIVAILCFLESLVFVSLLVPATALLVAAGTLVGAGLVSWYDLVVGGVIGCLVGDVVSYWLGRRLGPHADRSWPFKSRPEMLEKGKAFFQKHGWWGVFIGRFFGPLRAVVPTAAGVMGMPVPAFALVSITSALVFVPVTLMPGALVAAGASGAATGQLASVLPVILLFGTPLLLVVLFLARYKQRHASEIPDENAKR